MAVLYNLESGVVAPSTVFFLLMIVLPVLGTLCSSLNFRIFKITSQSSDLVTSPVVTLGVYPSVKPSIRRMEV